VLLTQPFISALFLGLFVTEVTHLRGAVTLLGPPGPVQ
jgi:hypothetical protein